MTRSEIVPRFVELVPAEVEEGVLYISVEYRTAVHRCCCGCGVKVITPLRPDKWRVILDGETVSLHPSVGNWSYACRSHYWIERNGVRWASSWSVEQVLAARVADGRVSSPGKGSAVDLRRAEMAVDRRGWWARLKSWFGA